MWLLITLCMLAYVLSSRVLNRLFPHESLAAVVVVAAALVALLQLGGLS